MAQMAVLMLHGEMVYEQRGERRSSLLTNDLLTTARYRMLLVS